MIYRRIELGIMHFHFLWFALHKRRLLSLQMRQYALQRHWPISFGGAA